VRDESLVESALVRPRQRLTYEPSSDLATLSASSTATEPLDCLIMKYVALLRGINVGGSNKVDMRELRAALEAVGMASVVTYINSGNVIFSTDIDDRPRLTAILEHSIRERFGFPVDVLLLDSDQMRSIVNTIPAGWTNDESMKCDVLFLWADVDRPSILEQIVLKPEIEDVLYVPGAVIRRIDRQNATKSGLTRLVGTPLYKKMTIRNCNTARRLLEFIEE
jgi:uncharacterized protein (DUF1697 family)